MNKEFELFNYLYERISIFINDLYYADVCIVNRINSIDEFCEWEDFDDEYTPFYSYISINFDIDGGQYKIQIPYEMLIEVYEEDHNVMDVINFVNENVKAGLVDRFRHYDNF